MKAPVFKFAAISLLMLATLSGIKGDSSPFCEGNAVLASEQNSANRIVLTPPDFVAQDAEAEEKEKPAFRFPNVFDALRLIF